MADALPLTLTKRFPRSVCSQPYEQRDIAVALQYGEGIELRLLLPTVLPADLKPLLGMYRDAAVTDVVGLVCTLRTLDGCGLDLDEGQRIKNWEAKTTRVVKGLRSPFALVLSGTPLENRLEELYSVVQFVDEHRLGPAFRFLHRHRVVDERGKVEGYRNLDELRERLKPILLRRTRQSVMRDLPPGTNEIIRVTPTREQLDIHDSHLNIVSMIVRKKYISEMDLLRLQKALLMCRLAANGSYLVNTEEPIQSVRFS